ncbi:MAG: serine/threonine-protein kinase [Planctomycetota bacterium]
MSTDGDSGQRDPIDLLAEQFLQRHRKGDRVSVESFAAEHPAHREGLCDLLPTLLALEQVKRDRESSGSGRAGISVPALEQVGDFRIVRELGRGGMGVVFEAVQESLGRKVALKVLPQASLLTGNQLERFRREAQIAAQLHHSNIVPVFGSGESEGYHWYAMQFISGESLDRWRQQQAEAVPSGSGAWRARSHFVARIGAQAASALHYAHGEGTLHRDVKPANLLLENDDHLWVTDFGLAKALEAEGLTHSGDLLGTLQYMAPEQFVGRYDVCSEVYALGVTLYELLVLRPAFAAKTRSELMEAIRTQQPESLQRLCPDVPEDLVIVIEKAMARDAADRYRSAHELEQDLHAFLEDRPIAARRQSVARSMMRWCRRNRALSALAASTLLAAIGAGITGWVAYGITDDALGKAKASAEVAAQQSSRAENNLGLSLTALGEIFDALVGRDPALALDEDPDTGEQTIIAPPVLEPRDVDLLEKMLAFYDLFATQNRESQSLRLDTARACRRLGAIHARLGAPQNLDEAARAYEQALTHLSGVTERDVRRETAAVHVDLGQLEQRRGKPETASQHFFLALTILDVERSSDTKAMRFERAQANFLLARHMEFRPEGGPGGPRGGPGAGPRPPERTREMIERSREARKYLQLAQVSIKQLLVEEPENPEFRALMGRCLLSSTRGPFARLEDRPEREREREESLTAGLEIFRDLVAKNPDRDQYRFELCTALLEVRRSDRPGSRGRDRELSSRDIEVLREAKLHAERLVHNQPLFHEYQAMRGQVGSALGERLLRRSVNAPEAEKHELRVEAEAELRAGLLVEQSLVQGDRPAEPRFVRQTITTRAALGLLCAESGRQDQAREQATAIVGLLRALAERRNSGRPPIGDPRSLEATERLLGLVDLPELAAEVRDLKERWESRSQSAARRDGAPGEPRRGGR